jgi:DNA-directed RNA polymerase subunit RPC12/RpoP
MTSVKDYKCLSCGAALEFNPATQNWKCHYCLNEFNIDQLDANLHEKDSDHDMPELDSYQCSNCGAELIADTTTSATFCLYCKSPAIIKTRFSGRFKPKSLIPFKITKDQAKDIYGKWIRKKILAPSEFKTRDEIDKITGIYAPFWLFDCKADGTIEGDATRVRSWRRGNYRYTETKYYKVIRSGNACYKRIPVDASKKLDDKFMHMIEPFQYSDMTGFSMKYMSGFMAERYDVEASDAEVTMTGRVKDYIEARLRGTVGGYTTFTVRDRRVKLLNVDESYSMLPIYLMINKYKGKDHIFIVNGQTGKVVGNTPISLLKQILMGASIFVAVWIIAVFGGALFV